MNFLKKNKKAFSLIELSIVILVIGLIIAAVNAGSKLIKKAETGMAAYELATGVASSTDSTPKTIDNLTIWLDATQIKDLSNGDPIQTWKNMSGNGKDATQTNATYMPIFRSGDNGINKLNSVEFDGVDDFFNFDGTDIVGSDYTVFVVEKRGDALGNMTIFGSSPGNGLIFGYYSSGMIVNQYQGNWYLPDVGAENITPGITRIHDFYHSSVDAKKYFLNGIEKGFKDYKIPLSSYDNARIGHGNYGFYKGKISEIIFYNKKLSDSERVKIESYLGKKWGVAVVN